MKRLTIFLVFSFIYGGLITPEDGATLNHIHVLFEWEQIPEADHYQIQITEDSDFSNPIVTEIIPKDKFYRAEEYHQNYLNKNNISSCGL